MADRFSDTRKAPIRVKINEDWQEFMVFPWDTLLDALRNELGLTGAKEGCGNGNCGACTVKLNGRTVDSCLVLAGEVADMEIETIEGVAKFGALHPIQEAFMELAALQCGFCTPGFIVSAKYLLEKNPNPTEAEIRLWLAGNLCRCTGYDKIVRAVQASIPKNSN